MKRADLVVGKDYAYSQGGGWRRDHALHIDRVTLLDVHPMWEDRGVLVRNIASDYTFVATLPSIVGEWSECKRLQEQVQAAQASYNEARARQQSVRKANHAKINAEMERRGFSDRISSYHKSSSDVTITAETLATLLDIKLDKEEQYAP